MANPYFNATYYLQNNPDLIAAGVNTVEGAWAHYVGFGAGEALQGAASRSPAPWFDITYYLSQNADLVTSGLTAGQLFEHFVNFGISEGRAPSADANVNSESLAAYAAANADLREAFGIEEGAELTEEQEIALAQHFYAFGYAEPREGKPSEPSMNDGETFSLTTSADNIVGTTGDDTIVAAAINQLGEPATTLQAFDSIDGGAGRDTLNIYVNGDKNATQAGTVKNVEVINIYNTEADAPFGGEAINASKFEGAEEIWQIDGATAITKLASGVVAGFQNTGADDLEVEADGKSNSASVVLKDVVAEEGITVNVGGDVLDTVELAGEVVDEDGVAQELTLSVAAGAKAKTLNVNTASNVVLTAAGAALTAIDATASTGDIEFDATGAINSVTTGSGDDDVSVSELAEGTKNATVNTGEGDDNITVSLQTGVKYAINGGAGDDVVTLEGDRQVATTDSIDGGDGVDTVALAAKAEGAYVADDYIVLTKVLKNFEVLNFTSVVSEEAALDASKLSNYKSFIFDEGGVITKVGADQTLSTAGGLKATAAGFIAAKETTAATYAGTLDITVTAEAEVEAYAETVSLTVNAGADDVDAVLGGGAKTATVVLNNKLQDDDTYTLASVVIEQTEASSLIQTEAGLGALSSITLSGNGFAYIAVGDTEGDAASYNLVTIDASGLNSTDENGEVGTGLVYESNNTKVETITLGAGEDYIILAASTYAATDVITGFNADDDALFLDTDGTFEKYVSEQTDLDLLLKEAAESATAGNNLVFQFGGDTYVFVDTGDQSLIEDSDILVKLTGTIDLDDLIGAINVEVELG